MSVTATPPPGVPLGWPVPGAGRPAAVPPSCFSELYALNQCYNDIQAMEQILSKVITNLFQTDPALVATVVNAIAASGSNVPLIGVTNGSNAQPGQVGEFVTFTSGQIAYSTANTTSTVSLGVLQPGDWDCWAYTDGVVDVHDVAIQLSPVPAGFSNQMLGYQSAGDGTIALPLSMTARASISIPSLIVFEATFNQSGTGVASGNTVITFNARRRR